MSLRIRSITFDCADPYRLVQFWSGATGFVEDPANPDEPGDPEGLLLSPDGSGWVVLGDPEGNEFCIERSDAERTP